MFGQQPDENPDEKADSIYKKYLRLCTARRVLIAVLCIAAALNVIFGIYYYNRLVRLNQRVKMARADIESCLQMRENLIPVLINTVSDFVRHEDDIFLHAADMRAGSIGSQRKTPKEGAIGKPEEKEPWSEFLSKVFAVAERYPDLKTAESFQTVLLSVSDAEKAILEKRITYNSAALEMNTLMITFPSNLYAIPFGFKRVNYFQWKSEPEWITTLRP